MPAKYFAIPKKVNKTVSKFPMKVQHRIDQAFDTLKQNPLAGTKLGGQLSKYYKFRLGDYRIISRVSHLASQFEVSLASKCETREFIALMLKTVLSLLTRSNIVKVCISKGIKIPGGKWFGRRA